MFKIKNVIILTLRIIAIIVVVVSTFYLIYISFILATAILTFDGNF